MLLSAPAVTPSLDQEIARRRTFAIISHPDAGKTTLTEKLLLYGGAVQLAGSVTARRKQRATTSDWMELEKQRGISVSSTVLQFDYSGYRVNLLDTPGHQDFSEDTYRVLTAVDAAIMVIDAGKGIEAQTRKLFEVCKRRGVPIFTFMNKLDRPAREPIDLLDELESVLGMATCPMNYPLGLGPDFRGVYDRFDKQVHLFERTVGGAYRAPLEISDLDAPVVRERLDEATFLKTKEEIEMLEMAGAAFDPEAVLRGELSPVFFGSAANNFGVQLLLDGFLKYSAAPAGRWLKPRSIREGEREAPRIVELVKDGETNEEGATFLPPTDPTFSGFVFKIQANMDPRHRDRIAFVRVCSGKFERDMAVTHLRTGKKVRLSSPQKLFAQEREIVDEAFPGDIVGLVGHDAFGIGDTLSEQDSYIYDEIPRFAPECFAYLRNPQTAKYKQFRQGIGPAVAGGCHPGVSPPRLGVERAAAGGGGSAAIRGCAVPAPERIRRGVAAGKRLVGPGALARGGLRSRQGQRPQAAHGRDRGRRQRRPPGRVVPERMVAALLQRPQRRGRAARHPGQVAGQRRCLRELKCSGRRVCGSLNALSPAPGT